MKFFILILSSALFSFSCAPVKFARSNAVNVDPNVSPTGNSVVCSPKINGTSDTFSYSTGGSLPAITSSCNINDLTYQWIVKKSDATVISATIPGLEQVADPAQVDFQVLGAGAYYVFLEARSSTGSSTPYIATTPLEFIVPGPGVGNNLICDPKLNGTFTSVSVGENDPNPEVRANCNPQAAMYLWTVKKTGLTADVQVPGLSTESQTPDFKSLGAGEYKVTLYATSPNSGAWRSSTPLVVVVSGAPVETPRVSCTPRINGSLTELTLTSMSPKPLISANCNPADVQYSWSVTKGGMTVSNSGISGANSNPDFVAAGNGTYIINLTATKSGMTSWSSSKPLVITVDATGGGLTIQCAPRLNGQSVAMTILSSGPNPAVTANCQPADIKYEWVITRGGQRVSVSGLDGASSTPQFAQAGLGTYLVYLTATRSGYNSYVSPSPLEVSVAPVVAPTRLVNYTKNIEYTDNKVDILLVIDDSNSMLADNLRLAQRMNDFVTDLKNLNIDWQVCTTITRSKANARGDYQWGPSIVWANETAEPRWILKPNPTANEKFIQTIQNIGAGIIGSDDERGIKAAYNHVSYAKYPDATVPSGFKDWNQCHRPDASLSVILISDEDVRSIGGNSDLIVYPQDRDKPLEPEDLPENFINKVKQTLGADKRFTFNSIIVKPNDTTCMASQDAEDAKSHYGYKYDELSKATGGYVGSICDADYKSNLNIFKDRIVNSLASVPLECAPVGDVKVTITPSMGEVKVEVRNNSNSLVFTPAILANRRLDLEYHCPLKN